MALVISLLVYLLTASLGECAEPVKCENLYENNYACSSFDFSDLPEDEQLVITVHTKDLQQLKEISPKSNVLILEIINSVNSIEPNSFKDLTGLGVLILQDNPLPVIESGTFSNLDLTSLVLQDAQISEIEPNAFKKTKLSLLRISGNDLKEIKKGIFDNLDVQQLDLFTNKISSIEDGALANLPNVSVLKLYDNALTDFNAKRIFGGAQNLQILHLQNNKLSKLNGNTFNGLENLLALLLGSNQIDTIAPETFNLPNLKKLDLTNNKIQTLDGDILSGLNSLWELYVDNNELTFLPPEILSQFPKLQKISLGGNPWQCDCLDSLLEWIEENQPGVFQGSKPACIDTQAKCDPNFSLTKAELENFKKQHPHNFEVYN